MRKSVVSNLLVVALMVILLTPDPAQGWWRRRRWVPKSTKAYQMYRPLTLLWSDLEKVVALAVAPCDKRADMVMVAATLATKFDQFDANDDDTLTGAELDNFNTFLGTYNACP